MAVSDVYLNVIGILQFKYLTNLDLHHWKKGKQRTVRIKIFAKNL